MTAHNVDVHACVKYPNNLLSKVMDLDSAGRSRKLVCSHLQLLARALKELWFRGGESKMELVHNTNCDKFDDIQTPKIYLIAKQFILRGYIFLKEDDVLFFSFFCIIKGRIFNFRVFKLHNYIRFFVARRLKKTWKNDNFRISNNIQTPGRCRGLLI